MNPEYVYTKILDFRGFDSSRSLLPRGGMPRPLGDFPEMFESRNLSRDNLSRKTYIDIYIYIYIIYIYIYI